VNAVVAPTRAEADRLALPQLLTMLALRTGAPLEPLRLVEEAEDVPLPDAHRPLVDGMRSRWVIGDPGTARARIEELAAAYAVDEVMVNPVAGAHRGEDPARSAAREDTLRLLAA
jgi:alkanesulfonate monooxygenase SsuD/methylene tetrahydromethanopterin reductase-like flavin-dependent oxidoreductase (luciferase family)